MGNFRFMRMIVFFDLPTITTEDRRNYRLFRKMLIKNGFIMLQESVYCKLMISPSVEKSINNLLQKNKPPKGLIQKLIVTEKQFVKMNFIVGESTNDIIDSEDGVIVLWLLYIQILTLCLTRRKWEYIR